MIPTTRTNTLSRHPTAPRLSQECHNLRDFLRSADSLLDGSLLLLRVHSCGIDLIQHLALYRARVDSIHCCAVFTKLDCPVASIAF